jgi:competence protein ComEC
MISHGDMDHRGGMRSLLRSVPVAQLMLGPSVGTAGLRPSVLCQRGRTWTWDQVRFEVLHPQGPGDLRDNDSSCVLRIAGQGGSALLTGDIQSEAEGSLVASGLGRTDIVIAPHHGSRTSSTDALIDATHARIVAFSVGYRNRWGFPKSDVVGRWRACGAQTFSTQDSGSITVDIGLTGIDRPQQFRLDRPHYWRGR